MIGFSEFAASIGLSELQLSLGLIGFGLLVIVMIYNAFRLRKSELEDLDSAAPDYDDASSHHERAEPILDLPETRNELNAPPKIDSLIDCVIAFRLPEAISGLEIISHLSQWPKNSLHPWMCEGLVNQTSASEVVWEPIKKDGQYLELQTAIQLANRQGPIGVVDLSDFTTRSQALANALDAEIDFPPVNKILQDAQQVDQFAAQCDIQLGVTIIPKNNPWNLAEIKSAANHAGFKLSRDGRQFHRLNNGLIIYNLIANKSNFLHDDLSKADIQSVTLLLDLPKVAQATNAFRTMLNDACLLGDAIRGNLVDDFGRPLINEAVNAIEAQVNSIYQTMAQHGISAGSSSAHRLFS